MPTAADLVAAKARLATTNLPRSWDESALCLGEAVTPCCGAFVTFHDDTLICKACYQAV